MIFYMHIPILITCFFALLFMRRWWLCISRMSFVSEVGKRAPSLVQGDVLAAVFLITPFVISIVDAVTPTPSFLAVVLSLACLGASSFALRNSGSRFAGNWTGTRESALRTIATLRIIDAAELAHALKIIHQHETPPPASQTIDVEAHEVRK